MNNSSRYRNFYHSTKELNLFQLKLRLLTIGCFTIFSFIGIVSLPDYPIIISDNISVYASEIESGISTPNIDAKTVYETGTIVLGNNVKNLIVLIPDEAHHGNGEAKEARFITQSFLPEAAVINKGTKVIWFSADVNHEHTIILNDKTNSGTSQGQYDSGVLEHNTDSKPMVFNILGNYEFYSPNVSQEAKKKDFVMKGYINVVDQPQKLLHSNSSESFRDVNSIITSSNADPLPSMANSNSNKNQNIETVGVFMVPSKEVENYIQNFQNRGFSIDSSYTFKDVRGIARGTDSEQTLLVWTAGPNMTVDDIITELKDITPTLPYK